MQRAFSWLHPLTVAGLLSACAYGYLSLHAQTYAGASLLESAIVWGVCATLCFATWFYYHQNNVPIPAAAMLFWALCFRLIGITGFPILEDDFYRYLWDGRMLIESGSPYTHAPAEFFDTENLTDRFEEILDGINYPHIATVYGPVCQWVFALAYLVAPGEAWPLQLIFGLLDFALVLLLLRLAPAKYVFLYAWSPLIIKEFAYTAHTDILGVFLVFAAIMARRRSYWCISALLLSLAVGSRVFAIILVPLLLGLHWRAWLSFIAGISLITLPFLSLDPWLPAGLGAMAEQWLFNAPLYSILFTLLPAPTVKLMMLTVFAITWCLYAKNFDFTNNKLIPRGDWLFAMLFLCMPVVNAWYLIWPLAFAVIFPSRWAWTASVAVLLCYVAELTPDYQLPIEVMLFEYGLILCALLIDWRKPVQRDLTAKL